MALSVTASSASPSILRHSIFFVVMVYLIYLLCILYIDKVPLMLYILYIFNTFMLKEAIWRIPQLQSKTKCVISRLP